jgi:AcrR family transcriptional regulator
MSAEMARARRAHRPVRRARAASQTRAAILAAAMRLFLERGYGGATVSDIAREAGTAIPTVYASAGGKAAILATLIADAQGDPIVEDTLAAVRERTDPGEVIRAAVRGVRTDNERYHDIVRVMVTAASVDESVAASLVASDREYRTALGEVAVRLGEVHPLTVSLARATDILWFYLGHQAWHICVAEQGWSWDEAEAWLAAQVVAALVAPVSPGAPVSPRAANR